MKDSILRLVRRELEASRRRGGDDLVAEWADGWTAFGEKVIELRERGTGRKHELYVAEHQDMYALKIADYGVSEVLGIVCAGREGTITDSEYVLSGEIGSADEQRRFARSFGRLLDEGRGRFEPQRDYGVAIDGNARFVLLAIKPAIPDDGAISLTCNVDPSDDADYDLVTFIGPDAEPVDLWLRMGSKGVTAYDPSGVIGEFQGMRIKTELKDLVEERIAAFRSPYRP